MGLDPDTTFTWYGHSCFEVRTPGGKTILIDPFFANPRSPRTHDSIERCDLMLVTHGLGSSDVIGSWTMVAVRLPRSWRSRVASAPFSCSRRT